MSDFGPPDPWDYPQSELNRIASAEQSIHFLVSNNASKYPEVIDIYYLDGEWVGFDEMADSIRDTLRVPEFGTNGSLAERGIVWYTIRRLKQLMVMNVDSKWGQFEWTAVG